MIDRVDDLTESLNANYGIALFVIGLPRRWYSSDSPGETEEFSETISTFIQQPEELGCLKQTYRYVGIGNYFSGNTKFLLNVDGVHINERGCRQFTRLIHEKVLMIKNHGKSPISEGH